MTNHPKTIFNNDITARGVIASLISLGIIEEDNPPRVSICFHDSEIIQDGDVCREILANYTLSISEKDFCNSNLHAFTVRSGNYHKFFDTSLTFNDVLDMHVKYIDVSRTTYTWSDTILNGCSVILTIPGLAKLVQEGEQ